MNLKCALCFVLALSIGLAKAKSFNKLKETSHEEIGETDLGLIAEARQFEQYRQIGPIGLIATYEQVLYLYHKYPKLLAYYYLLEWIARHKPQPQPQPEPENPTEPAEPGQETSTETTLFPLPGLPIDPVGIPMPLPSPGFHKYPYGYHPGYYPYPYPKPHPPSKPPTIPTKPTPSPEQSDLCKKMGHFWMCLGKPTAMNQTN